MTIFEYDEEQHKQTIHDEGYEEGYDSGYGSGELRGKVLAYSECGLSPENISKKLVISVDDVRDILSAN